MTSQSVQSAHRYSPMAIVLVIIGAALAVAVGFGLAAVTLETTTTVEVPTIVEVPAGPDGVGSNNDAYTNPDPKLRELMIRRCGEHIGC